jgi:ABC-type transporter Mla MlaB component
MALFSKPPAKKPAPAKSRPEPAARPAAVSARALAAKAGLGGDKPRQEPVHAEVSITGASLIEWSPQPQAFEVAQANPGLCAVLENAALLYASGQAPGARTLLEQGVASDHDTKQSPLAWLALFDLVQRAGDHAAYEQLSVQYSVQFERSAPAWEGKSTSTASAKPAAGGFVAITGKLGADSAPQVEGLRRAIAKRVAHARLDLSGVAGFDDAGAQLLAKALAEARKSGLALTIERAQKLRGSLEGALQSGREAGEGAWQLSLELLQWAHEQAAFDDRAIEYAIAFEVSPPSWEPPPKPAADAASAEAAGEAAAGETPADGEVVALSGVIAGSAAPQVAKILEFSHGRQLIPIDMSRVERVDFVCAGALLNAVNRVEGSRKAVQIHGATPIIRALLLLIGLSPRHFVKKLA